MLHYDSSFCVQLNKVFLSPIYFNLLKIHHKNEHAPIKALRLFMANTFKLKDHLQCLHLILGHDSEAFTLKIIAWSYFLCVIIRKD